MPRASRVAVWSFLRLMRLLTWVIFSISSRSGRAGSRGRSGRGFFSRSHAEDLTHRLATLESDVLGAPQAAKARLGRAHHVDGVCGPQALGEDVMYAAQLEQSPHAAAGDDAGTGGSRAQKHSAGSVVA